MKDAKLHKLSQKDEDQSNSGKEAPSQVNIPLMTTVLNSLSEDQSNSGKEAP
jgi:hypothetical protein